MKQTNKQTNKKLKKLKQEKKEKKRKERAVGRMKNRLAPKFKKDESAFGHTEDLLKEAAFVEGVAHLFVAPFLASKNPKLRFFSKQPKHDRHFLRTFPPLLHPTSPFPLFFLLYKRGALIHHHRQTQLPPFLFYFC
eukprot:TRINITY_DN11852_c0_g4_i1.p1 TRINITY_DN11852_c0_g4~~TRINITY_DN11852_c0_g4_i1.p1  ORF type:complete len:136 (-),score=10.79 TRINITY_DN11852_c0_g4_i1:93-500(-)